MSSQFQKEKLIKTLVLIGMVARDVGIGYDKFVKEIVVISR